MRATFLSITAALALTACVEVDMTLEVLGEDTARVTGFMQMDRQMYDMSGGDDSFCPSDDGGTLVLTDTHARCNFDKTGTFDEIMPADAAGDTPTDLQGEIEYLGDNRVRVVLPLGSMQDGMEDMGEDPQMIAMMRQMFAGMSISFSVQGREIESSTGVISDDGTRASYTLGVEDLIPDTPVAMPDFETIVRY